MSDSKPYTATTRGIAVSVEPSYLESKSSPEGPQYFWAYRVIIVNQSRETVQLLSRHWMITNAQAPTFFLRLVHRVGADAARRH
jgi:uncharacterized protein affecting Mg2+/Co2+ transport